MKKLSLLFCISAAILLSSCKKEVSPELEITVFDNQGAPAKNKLVKISVDGANKRLVNAKVIDSARTDTYGKAFFQFDNTILIDIALYGTDKTIVDSASVLCETKRLKSKEDNVYERTLTFR